MTSTHPVPPPRRGHFAALAVAWTIFAIYGSLVPLKYHHVAMADAIRQFRNLPPLWVGMGTRADWVANILLFIPLTCFWMGALVCDRRRLARLAATVAVVPVASAAAVALEFTQIWFAGRTVSRNDIVAEAAGSVIGVVLWLGLGQHAVAWLRRFARDRTPRSRVTWLLEAYCLGLFIYSVIPLDLTISLTELYHKYLNGQVLLVPFAYHYESISTAIYQFFADVAEFVPVGAWIVFTQRRRAPALPAWQLGALGGGLIAGAIEFAQLLVLSRFTDVTDILLGTLGAGLGGWLIGRLRPHAAASESPRPHARVHAAVPWLLGIAAYSVFLMAGFWFPFEITRDHALIVARLDGFFRVPFLALYLGNEFNAVKQLLVRIVLFAPLGAMWAHLAGFARTRAVRQLVVFFGLVYAFAVALGIEIGEIFMPSKIADSTEVLLCFTGAVLGVLVVTRVFGADLQRERSHAAHVRS